MAPRSLGQAGHPRDAIHLGSESRLPVLRQIGEPLSAQHPLVMDNVSVPKALEVGDPRSRAPIPPPGSQMLVGGISECNQLQECEMWPVLHEQGSSNVTGKSWQQGPPTTSQYISFSLLIGP
jgi:hypothetical protein